MFQFSLLHMYRLLLLPYLVLCNLVFNICAEVWISFVMIKCNKIKNVTSNCKATTSCNEDMMIIHNIYTSAGSRKYPAH